MAPKKTTKTNAHAPIEMERVAALCQNEKCLGYRVLEVPKVDAEAGDARNVRATCRCNNSLIYSKLVRNPDAPETQIMLLKRDVERLERENERVKSEHEKDRIRLETTDRVLEKLGRMNAPVGMMMPFRGFGHY